MVSTCCGHDADILPNAPEWGGGEWIIPKLCQAVSAVPWVTLNVAGIREGSCIRGDMELWLLEVGWVQHLGLG